MYMYITIMQSDDFSRSPTPLMENSRNVGVDNQLVQGSEGQGSERPSSLTRTGAGAGTAHRKRERTLISDNSDDSSLDSSDNDFEEQIRKLKVSCVLTGGFPGSGLLIVYCVYMEIVSVSSCKCNYRFLVDIAPFLKLCMHMEKSTNSVCMVLTITFM